VVLADHVELDYQGPELATRWSPPGKLTPSSHLKATKHPQDQGREVHDNLVVPGQPQPNAWYRLLLNNRILAQERPFVLQRGLNKIGLKPSLKQEGYQLVLRSTRGTIEVPLQRKGTVLFGRAEAWAKGYRIFGNMAGPVQAGDQVSLQRKNTPGVSIWSSTKLDEGGSFLFEGVRPGTWYVGLHRGNAFFLLGKSFNTKIEVKDHDLDLNLEARLPPP